MPPLVHLFNVKVNDKYASKGLQILGFPSNQFGGQEPGTDGTNLRGAGLLNLKILNKHLQRKSAHPAN